MLADHVFARKGVVTVLGMSNSLKFYFIFISLKYLDQHLIKETSLPIPRHTMYFFYWAFFSPKYLCMVSYCD